MPLKAAVRFRLRDGSAHEKALPKPAGGEVKMEDVATEIALLAQQVVRHADNPWIQVDGGGWVKTEHVVSITPVDEPI